MRTSYAAKLILYFDSYNLFFRINLLFIIKLKKPPIFLA